MIEDQELRELFRSESAEHIDALEQCLLRLEKEPCDPDALEASFREAHSLKGAARMLGLTAIERLSHRIESLLGAAHRGRSLLSPRSLELLYRGIDALRRLAGEALTGTASPVDTAELIRQLQSVSEPEAKADPDPGLEAGEVTDSGSAFPNGNRPSAGSGPEAEAAVPPRPDDSHAGPEPEPPVSPPEARGTASDDFRIDTIRVETGTLDQLMDRAGELGATRLRIARRLADLDRAATLWEALAKKMRWAGGPGRSNDRRVGGPSATAVAAMGEALASLRGALGDDSARLGSVSDELEEAICSIRLLPFSTLFRLFPRMVRDLAKETGKEVRLIVEGGETSADKRILEEMKDPLMHILRNAVDHGIETPAERLRIGKPAAGTVTLRAFRDASHIVVEAGDDGRGLDVEAIRRVAVKKRLVAEETLGAMSEAQIQSLIFAPGVSTSPFVSDLSGRGVGLDVVRMNVERLKGSLQVDSSPIRGFTIRMLLPLTVATLQVAIVTAGGRIYALPLESIRTIRRIDPAEIFTSDGRRAVTIDRLAVPVVHLSELLSVRHQEPRYDAPPTAAPAIIVGAAGESVALLVDEILDEQQIDLKPAGSILQRVRNISGTAILADGGICMILNPHDLLLSARKREAAVAEPEPKSQPQPTGEERKNLLVAEDSITVRTQMKRILEGAGYEVTVAVDGLDALDRLSRRRYDGLVSDIMMPKMTGLQLTERIRRDPKYREMPVILVTSLASDEDRKRGIDAGADAYITKSSFDQRLLIETLERLI